jgi:hypothetical protein
VQSTVPVVGDRDAEFLVDGSAVFGVGLSKDLHDSLGLQDE